MNSERKQRREAAAIFQRKADDAAAQLLCETDPRQAYLLQLGVSEWGAQARELRGRTPQERRTITAVSLCTCASALFLGAASLGGDLSAEIVLAGLFGPAGITGALTWFTRSMSRDADVRTSERPGDAPPARRQRVGAR